MRIAYLSDQYSRGMGYLQNCLPRVLAALGHEVHVIASQYQVSARGSEYLAVYERFLGPPEQPLGSFSCDGYTVHRLRLKRWSIPGFVGLEGLRKLLLEMKPDVVESYTPPSGITFQAAAVARKGGYRLFTACHVTSYIIGPWLPKWRFGHWRRLCFYFARKYASRLAHVRVQKCFAATADCGVVAERHFGVPEVKICVIPLGSDTEVVYPVRDAGDSDARSRLRARLGYGDDEIVCIYTGRFTEQKNPVVLARAIELLRGKGEPYAALFIGHGKQGEEIERYGRCMVIPFMKHADLPAYYRASDIGVWPSHDSMSMLDAAGCGLPIVVSERLAPVERYDGNGLTYREPDAESLARALADLREKEVRWKLGCCGAEKIRARFNWTVNAKERLEHYEEAHRLNT